MWKQLLKDVAARQKRDDIDGADEVRLQQWIAGFYASEDGGSTSSKKYVIS